MATTAQVIQFLLSPIAASGITLSGGQAFFFAAGTSTPKAVWIDRNKTTEAANPYTLAPNGTAQLYADGLYRVVIKDSNGATKYDWDFLSFVDNASDLAEINAGVSAKTVRWVSDYADLAAAVAAIGSTPATLAYKTDQTLAAPLATPSTLELLPLDGAVIRHGVHTVTYAGGTTRWPMCQIFDGTGAVTGFAEAYPEWFTTNATPGTTDMTNAIKKAAAAVKGNLGVVKGGATSYLISSNVYFDNVAFQGIDGHSTQIRAKGAITAFTFTGSRKKIGSFAVWFDDYLTSAAPTSAVGVQFGGDVYNDAQDQFNNNIVEQVYVRHAGRSFTAVSTGTKGTLWNNTFINCRSDYQAEYGWYFNCLVGSTTQTWVSCMVDGVPLDGTFGYTATSAGWYVSDIDDVAWLSCQADDLYDGKGIYINLAGMADIKNFRSESSQLITDNSTLIYANAALTVTGVKFQSAVVNPGAGNSASVIRFGSGGSGVIGAMENQTISINSGTFYKLHTANISSGKGRVTINAPRMWMADVMRDSGGERTVFANKGARFGVTSSNPTSGTYEIGDQILTVAVGAGRVPGKTCVTAGTMGTLAGVTGTVALGSNLVTVNSTSSLREGDFVAIAGVAGTKRVVHIKNSTQVYTDSAADASVSAAAVSYVAATFADQPPVGMRTGIVAPTVTPYVIGERFLDTAANKWYMAKGTASSADWLLLN